MPPSTRKAPVTKAAMSEVRNSTALANVVRIAEAAERSPLLDAVPLRLYVDPVRCAGGHQGDRPLGHGRAGANGVDPYVVGRQLDRHYLVIPPIACLA